MIIPVKLTLLTTTTRPPQLNTTYSLLTYSCSASVAIIGLIKTKETRCGLKQNPYSEILAISE
ncbi:hypothetical protein IV64_GL001218 [Lactiplantibacillus xiangfangensis]|uniref:Uncharacterized protein n=1 Tax=Lactiplantibacillus xiangfangensis TaxID=942150 RepID=A0A0R2M0J1_9LACO|nr:hypothetical protein IV64_GL001218 [Lactiplantibacillus xiangfangensis]